MSEFRPNHEGEKKVKVHHRANKLKYKAGASQHEGNGYIDPRAIERAQTIVQKREGLYNNEVQDNLERLQAAWDKMKSGEPDNIADGLEELYHYANHIKDISSTYKYDLMQYFGESLRKFSEKIDVTKPVHLVIVQAHIDVMWVTFKENIKGLGDDKAQELMDVVALAIEKYSK
jgi:hypothetical protein